MPFQLTLPSIDLSSPNSRHLLYGVLLGLSLSITTAAFAHQVNQYEEARRERREKKELSPIELRRDDVLDGVTGLIGNTPLVRIKSLSDALGVEIVGKAEFLNPGGSVKDRVALRVIQDAEREGLLHPHTGSRIFEGTVGSTGISIATIAKARHVSLLFNSLPPSGYDTTIIMPDDVAQEKVHALLALGADVQRVRPASIVDKKQARFSPPLYIIAPLNNLAREAALHFGRAFVPAAQSLDDAGPPDVVVRTTAPRTETGSVSEEADLCERPRGFFADQFENRSNFDAHYEGTGPELWRQTRGRVRAFVSGAGTIAGVGRFLKSINEDVQVILADPEGSGLYNKAYVKHGVMFDRREAEGTKRRHQVDTVVEGIGINRLTHNFDLALPIIDDAFRVTDAEAVSMSRYLVQNDGLFLGSSSAANLVACIKLVRKMGWKDGEMISTILCDSGSRHYSKFWNDEYLRKAGIPIDTGIVEKMLAPDSSG
ncbi:PALP-domain-containing protein [Coniophora puteana RWD-64-598 SS2]|uniref:cysteine synthase n=1 Tax=Coniophora puteana (strain RWD-64-598) TaxID=741705 RepID=A0A5M3MWJ5_CONPW|nr:PALP-domain-containing protein [Coniophora puteana RWD-64-598 SS2]EIW83519.1 PALP-domain-containing protein [Coniophora puteana RWD-64-598 SS2]